MKELISTMYWVASGDKGRSPHQAFDKKIYFYTPSKKKAMKKAKKLVKADGVERCVFKIRLKSKFTQGFGATITERKYRAEDEAVNP